MICLVDIVQSLKKRWVTVAVVALVLVVALVATFVTLNRTQATQTAPMPPAPSGEPSGSGAPEPQTTTSSDTQPSQSASSGGASASASPADKAALAECDPVGAGFVPVRYTIADPKVDAKVLSLGRDAQGNIAAPPKDQKTTASWWNEGPRAGADRGKTVLSIHTYRNGGAVGNMLYDGGRNQLEPGTLVKLYGAQGQVACYEFSEATKVWVEDYDPNSNVMVDFDGNPLLTVIVCWDHRAGTDIWDSRVFFYFKPVTAA